MKRTAWAILAAAAAGITAVSLVAFDGWLRDPVRTLDRSVGVYPAVGRLSTLTRFRDAGSRTGRSDTEGRTALLRALADAERAATAGTSRSIRALAAAQLSLGRGDEAARTLEAAAIRLGDPRVLSDLAAVHLTSADPLTDIQALDVAARAFEGDPTSAEILFNYATAMEANGLERRARDVWLAYLAIDARSSWARQARASLARLTRAHDAETEPDGLTMRRLVEARLTRWASSAVLDPQQLSDACALADAHAARYGDQFLPAFCADARGPRAQRVAAGWLAFVEGRDLTDALQFPSARAVLSKAAAAFEGTSRAGLLATGYHLAVVDYQTGAIPESLRRMTALTERLRSQGFAQLHARAEWLHGIIDETSGQHSSALARFDSARRALSSLAEPENALAVHSLYAYALRKLGDYKGSWRQHHAVLKQAEKVQHSHRRQALFLTAGQSAAALGFDRAAALLLDEYVRAAEALDAPPSLAEAYLNRMNTVWHGRPVAVQQAELARIEQTALRIGDPDRRAFVLARVALHRARLSPPAEALRWASAAYSHIQQSGRVFLMPEALLARAQSSRTLGDLGGAEAALRAGIDEIDRQWSAIATTPHRISFFDTSLRLHETLADLLLSADRVDEAFAWADRARMRVLLRRNGTARPDITLDSFQRHLRPGTTALIYTKVLDTLRIWHITRDTRRLVTSPVSIAALEKMTAEWQRAVGNPAANEAMLTNVVARLFDALVRPAGPIAPGRLIIVPDWPLHGVPFAALRERDTGEFLVDRSTIVMAPSPSAAMGSHRFETPTSVLAVSPPAQSGAYAFLRPLPFAAREAADVGDLYPARHVLAGTAATKSRIHALVPGADVVHFATHAVGHAEDPALSYLLLAGESENDVRLTADEVEAFKASPPSVVVLAACGTASGPVSRSEGPMGLSRAFLAAGIPRVVATLWEIEDRASYELMVAFHRRLRAGRDPVEALSDVQRHAAQTQPIKHWSAFAVYATRLQETLSER